MAWRSGGVPGCPGRALTLAATGATGGRATLRGPGGGGWVGKGWLVRYDPWEAVRSPVRRLFVLFVCYLLFRLLSFVGVGLLFVVVVNIVVNNYVRSLSSLSCLVSKPLMFRVVVRSVPGRGDPVARGTCCCCCCWYAGRGS